MFESSQQRERSPIWTYLPIALGVFILLIAGAVYLSIYHEDVPDELVGVLHEGDSDFAWYSDYITIRDPAIQMGLNFAGNRIVMLSGVIENSGERTIDVVELNVKFFNYETLIWETTRTPIRPGPYTPPISPVAERAFTFYIEKIPEDWMSSHAEMNLSGFRFFSHEY